MLMANYGGNTLKNQIQIVGILLLLSIFAGAASNQKFRVPRLKDVGTFRHQVLAQTSPEFVEKRSGFTVLRKFYIAKWGVYRFEYGMALFQCRQSNCELLGEPVALKFYKECSGFQKDGRPKCKNLESARIDVTDPYASTPETQDKRKWYTCEDYGSPCRDRDDLNEFPSRYQQEELDLPY